MKIKGKIYFQNKANGADKEKSLALELMVNNNFEGEQQL